MESAQHETPAPSRKVLGFSVPLLILCFVTALTVGIRLRLINMPLERDEGEFAYAGQLMLQGIPPYQLCYNMKMPGIYAAYALIMGVFGQTTTAIHFGLILVNIASIWLMYALARRFYSPTLSVVAASVFALMSISPAVFGLSTHATQFVVCAALIGFLFLLRGQEDSKPKWFLIAGIFFGISFLMKQHGMFYCLFALAWSVIEARRSVRAIAALALGMWIPVLVTFFLLWRAGVFEKFWFWTITYAATHGTALPLRVGWIKFNQYLGMTGADAIFWIAASLGLVFLLKQPGHWPRKFFLAGLLLFSLAAVCPDFHFSTHYFVLVLPALSLLVTEFISSLPEYVPWNTVHPLWRQWPLALFAGLWLAVLCARAPLFFTMPPNQVSGKIFGPLQCFPSFVEISRHLREHSSEKDRIAVIGSEPEIYFYSHRHSATGYIYMYDLVQRQPYAEKMQRETIAEIEKNQPEFLVFVNNGISWLPDYPLSQTIIAPWFDHYAAEFYQPIGVANLNIGRAPTYYWGPDAEKHATTTDPLVMIFQKKSARR